jgi:hypothetical protein
MHNATFVLVSFHIQAVLYNAGPTASTSQQQHQQQEHQQQGKETG